MQNIPGWFPTTNKETLERLIKEHNVKTVLEIGSFVGLSTAWFAERVEKVFTIDPFDAITRINYLHGEMKEVAKNQLGNFRKNTDKYDNIFELVMTSEQAFNHHDFDLYADLIYIDGSHEYEDVKKDIEMWQNRATKILCGDDYTDSWPGVKKAVDECGLQVNKDQRLWYVKK